MRSEEYNLEENDNIELQCWLRSEQRLTRGLAISGRRRRQSQRDTDRTLQGSEGKRVGRRAEHRLRTAQLEIQGRRDRHLEKGNDPTPWG